MTHKSPLPAWWRKFAGYERWLVDGTCGRMRVALAPELVVPDDLIDFGEKLIAALRGDTIPVTMADVRHMRRLLGLGGD